MANSRSLYQLIHALSSAEKKYIRKYAQPKANEDTPNYLKLFDALQDLQTFSDKNEKELLQTVTISENLAEVKKYLYNFILKCLRNFHAEKNVRIKLQEYRTNIHLLLEKGLWQHALKYILKARKLSKEAGFGMDELTFLLLERRIIQQYPDKVSNILIQLQEASETRATQLVKEIGLLRIYENVFQAMRSGDQAKILLARLPEEVDAIIGADHAGYLNHASFDAKIQYYYIFSTFFRNEKKYIIANEYLKNTLDLFQSNAIYLKETEHQERYIRVLNNYFNNCYYANTLDEHFADIIEKIRVFPETTHQLKAEKFQNEYYIKVLYYIKKKNYKKVIDIAPIVEEGLQAYRANILINRRLTLEYSLLVAYFLNKDYDKAWEGFNAIINDKNYDSRKEIRLLAETLRLVIFFEKQEYRLLRSFAHAYIDNYGDRNDAVEVELIKCLYQIANVMEEKTMVEEAIPAMIKTELTALHARTQHLPQHEEIEIWLQEKLDSLNPA